ncbi:MAG: metal-sensitive transcriptional regulator [Spirochaetales bacterium]|nr:metal-sensitive transcriptional regulator [Spirochaetales bacterium]
MMNQSQKQEVLERLKKIAGQIGGIQKMVSENRYCIDILTQTRASAAAINKVEDLIMYQHLHTCVAESMKSDDPEDKNQKISEIIGIFSKFRKAG